MVMHCISCATIHGPWAQTIVHFLAMDPQNASNEPYLVVTLTFLKVHAGRAEKKDIRSRLLLWLCFLET